MNPSTRRGPTTPPRQKAGHPLLNRGLQTVGSHHPSAETDLRSATARRYNPGMAGDLIDDMKRCLGFGAAEAEALASLQAPLTPALPDVVDAFYRTLLRHPEASGLITTTSGARSAGSTSALISLSTAYLPR